MAAHDRLRAFRRNAWHVRDALALFDAAAGPLHVDDGYLQDQAAIDRYKRLAIPVRRALNPADRASFALAVEALRECGRGAADASRPARADWDRLQVDLDTTISLGAQKVTRRTLLTDWLKAAAFYDKLDRDRPYDRLVDDWGKAAESLAVDLARETAAVVLRLDEVAAEELEEPVVLPPPEPTPPPPPERKLWWWRRRKH
jgi:hypothetical protein